jgi:hypothetical protein
VYDRPPRGEFEPKLDGELAVHFEHCSKRLISEIRPKGAAELPSNRDLEVVSERLRRMIPARVRLVVFCEVDTAVMAVRPSWWSLLDRLPARTGVVFSGIDSAFESESAGLLVLKSSLDDDRLARDLESLKGEHERPAPSGEEQRRPPNESPLLGSVLDAVAKGRRLGRDDSRGVRDPTEESRLLRSPEPVTQAPVAVPPPVVAVPPSSPPPRPLNQPAPADATLYASVPQIRRTTGVIVATSGELAGEVYKLHEGENRLGRSTSSDVVLRSQRISREHATIVCKDGLSAISPLSKSNPTLVDGHATEECEELCDGSTFQLGETSFCYRAVSVEVDTRPQPKARTSTLEEVVFTAYHPRQLAIGEQQELLFYVHVPEARAAVQVESGQLLRDRGDGHVGSEQASSRGLARGVSLLAVPELAGCQFTPEHASISFHEDKQYVRFEVLVDPQRADVAPGTTRTGRISVYLGPLLIGEVSLSIELNAAGIDARQKERRRASSLPYQAIFVSYAHTDAAIVDQLERAYKVLGNEYVRDVNTLRAGQRWHETLLQKIEEADVFQLCWTKSASRSSNVEREWRHALGLERADFIRPIYWQRPMPEPPSDLAPLHFAFLELASPTHRT